MKKIKFILAALIISTAMFSQVGIQTATPSATLDIVSSGNTNTTKALEINNSAGTEMVTVLDNGNVGIGTTTPTEKLEINGAMKIANVRLIKDTGDDNRLIFQNTVPGNGINISVSNNGGTGATGLELLMNDGVSDRDNYENLRILALKNLGEYNIITNAGGTASLHDLVFKMGPSIEALRVDTSGNVSVGSGIWDPTNDLDIANTLGIGKNGGGQDIVYIQGGAGYGSIIETRYSDGTVNNLLSGNSDTYLNRYYGNVGIGTTAPSAKLEVAGFSLFHSGGNISTLFPTPSSILTVGAGDDTTYSGGTAMLHIKNAGNRGTKGHVSGSDLLRLDFSDALAMIVNKDGNVGIGTTAPAERLEVNGAIIIGNSSVANTCTKAGEIYWNGTNFMGCTTASGAGVQLNN